MVQHLADRLADQVQDAATTGTGLRAGIDDTIFTRQMIRQAETLILATCRGARTVFIAIRGLFQFRQIGGHVLETELQLVGIKALRSATELHPLQHLQNASQPRNLGLCFSPRAIPLAHQIADQRVQRFHVVRQAGKVDGHDQSYHAAGSSRAAITALSQFASGLSARRRRAPALFRRPPLDPFQKMRELLRCQGKRPSRLDIGRPDEDTMLQPLGEQTQTGAVPEHDLDETGIAPPEHEEMPSERILMQHLLHEHGQPKRDGERNEALDTFVYAHAALHGLISMGMRLNEEAEGREGWAPKQQRTPPSLIRSAWMG